MAHGFTGSCICRGTSRHGDKEADGELSGQMPPLPISTLSNVHCCFPKRPPVISNQIWPAHSSASNCLHNISGQPKRWGSMQSQKAQLPHLIKPTSDLWPPWWPLRLRPECIGDSTQFVGKKLQVVGSWDSTSYTKNLLDLIPWKRCFKPALALIVTGGYLLGPIFLIDLLGSQRHLKSLCIVLSLY